jgi:hypothetical protein
MANDLLRFSELLKEDEVNRKFNDSIDPKDILDLHRAMPTHNFMLAYNTSYPGTITWGNYPSKLISLDEEDIEYFKNKYLPKLNDEFQEELAKLKKRYNK